MRFLVTGAGGYIGTTLVPLLLEDGHDVVVVDRFFFGADGLPDEGPSLTLVRKDTRDITPGDLDGIEVVIDLAALSNDPAAELDPTKTWEINCAARVRTATLAKAVGVDRYVLPSSSSVYGNQDGIMDEACEPFPLTVYARANWEAEKAILALNGGGFTPAVARQATVFGVSRRMRFDLVVNQMVRSLIVDGRLRVFRDGQQWRPLIHVTDTARALVLLATADAASVGGEVFNVGGEHLNVRVIEIAEAVAAAVGGSDEFDWYGGNDGRSHRMDFRKARAVLGFEPRVAMEAGAKEVNDAIASGDLSIDDQRWWTVDWYRRLQRRWESMEAVVDRRWGVL